ncbi:MAG: hypothetical protein JW832_08925 [Deltaproteobacteria bacterium]|nr:hypothetical protein [Deltaproteobacteria bacterium]
MMLKNSIRVADKLYQNHPCLVCPLAAVIILLLDYISGRPIHFPIAYVLPVGMAAWRQQKRMAYAMAVILPLARVGFHFPWQETQSLSIAALNALIAGAVLVLYAHVALQERLLSKKVRRLEGLLPICAACKRIRTEKGEYVQMETYISDRTEASFTHGICPECAKKLYPEYYKDNQK